LIELLGCHPRGAIAATVGPLLLNMVGKYICCCVVATCDDITFLHAYAMRVRVCVSPEASQTGWMLTSNVAPSVVPPLLSACYRGSFYTLDRLYKLPLTAGKVSVANYPPKLAPAAYSAAGGLRHRYSLHGVCVVWKKKGPTLAFACTHTFPNPYTHV